jgi:hypothetical protein
MRLLLRKSLSMNEDVVERIIQAGLFYADTVAVRATATLQDTSRVRVAELADIGLMTTWAHEYEVTDGGRIRDPGSRRIVSSHPDNVVGLDVMRSMAAEIDDELRTDRELPYAAGQGALREGISEIVQLKHAISLLRMTELLDLDGVIADSTVGAQFAGGVVTAGERRANVVRELVSHCRFGSLAELPVTVIDECRRSMPKFRAFLDQMLSEEGPERPAVEIAAEIHDTYLDLIASGRNGAAREQKSWDVVGSVLPSSVIISVLDRQIRWFRHRGRRRPFLLLSQLHDQSRP